MSIPEEMLLSQLDEMAWVAGYVMNAHPDVYAEAIMARQQEGQQARQQKARSPRTEEKLAALLRKDLDRIYGLPGQH
jgi:hypothetical protein